MTKVVEAIYENGVFKPVKKVKLPEHERFKLIISPSKEKGADAAITKKTGGTAKRCLAQHCRYWQ